MTSIEFSLLLFNYFPSPHTNQYFCESSRSLTILFWVKNEEYQGHLIFYTLNGVKFALTIAEPNGLSFLKFSAKIC